jgi:hypothetical protein
MIEEYNNGMSFTRYSELASGECDELTDEEISNGWYFDDEADDALINKNWK